MQYNVEIVLKLFDQVSKALSQPLEQVKKLDETLKNTQQTAENLQSPFKRLQKTIKETFNPEHLEKFSQKLDDFAGKMLKATALPMGGILGSLAAYSEFQEQEANLEVAYMVNKKAMTPQAYRQYEEYVKKIKQEAVELGDAFPGSTKDYHEMATALKEAGLSAKVIANGAFKAAAELWVLTKDSEHESTEQVAEYIAHFKEAYGIKNKDFQAFVNQLQKVKFATGLRLDEMAYASEYLAPSLRSLGIQGLQNFKTISVLLGALHKAGVSGTVAGTALKDAFERIVDLQKNLNTLQKKGINFQIDSKQFFEGGRFHMLKFLEVMRDKLSQVKDIQTRMQIMQQIFGQRGLTAMGILLSGTKKQAEEYAKTLLRMGKITQEQYQKMMQNISSGQYMGIEKTEQAIAEQANIQQRMKVLLHTFHNTFKAMAGTFLNFAASVGGLMAPSLVFIMNKINDFLSLMQGLIDQHKTLARLIILPPAAFVGFLALAGVVAKVGSAMFSFLSGGIQVASMLFKISGAVFRVGMMIFRFLIPALNMLRVVFLTNPLGLFITAVVAAIAVGYLLYTHWKQITAWFKTHFPNAFKDISAFIEGFKKAIAPALKSFHKAIQPIVHALSGLWDVIKSVFGAIVQFFTPAHETMKKTSHTAKQLSHAVKSTANAFKTFKDIGEVVGFIFSLPLRGIVLLIDAIKWLVKAIVGAVGVIESIFTSIANILRTAFRVYISIIQTEFRIATAIFHFYIQLWIRIFKLLEQAGIFVFRKIAQSVNFIKNAWNTAIRFISSINLFKAGQNILNTLVQGIESVAMKPVQVMKNVVQKIRNLLPFSPAKEGPLRDLHRIKLIQTIADTIKPDPLVEKMRQALAQAVSIPIIPAPTAAVGMGSHTTFHIIVNSTNNFTTDTKPEVANTIAGNIEKEVRRVLAKINQDKERRKY